MFNDKVQASGLRACGAGLAALLGLALLAAPGNAAPGRGPGQAKLRVAGAHHPLTFQQAPAKAPARRKPVSGPLAARIADAYRQLELLTATSPDPVRVKISEIREGRTEDIARSRIVDLVTATASQAVDVAREETREPEGPAVRYTLHWSPMRVDAATLPSGSLVDLWESEQRVRLNKDATKKGQAPVPLDRFDRYARYRVSVVARDLDLEYSALAVERSANGETVLVDPVLWMVNSAAAEGLPPARSAPGAFRDYLSSSAGAGDPLTDTACTAQNFGSSSSPDDGPSIRDTTDHILGSHSVDTYANFMCECKPDCTSVCTPIVMASANESPDILLIQAIGHRASSNSSQGQLGVGMPGAGASCDAWAGACVKRCLFGLFCDIQISFYGLQVTLPNDCLIQSSSNRHGSCPACSPPPPPPPPPGGGGNDPGSGGGPCQYGQLVTPEECVYYCGGFVDGDYCDVPY